MKVLVVSHNSFSKVFNNGKTLEAIFSSFKKDELSQLFFSENEDPDFEFCENYFKITDFDVLKNTFSLSNPHGKELELSKRELHAKSSLSSMNKGFFSIARKRVRSLIVMRDLLWKLGGWKAPSLFEWLKNINPDVVFYVGGNFGFSHDIARYISKNYKIPLAVYFTDDYVLNPINTTIIDRIQHVRIRKFYRNTINSAKLHFVIGDEMVYEYSQFYKKKFVSIMNSVELAPYPDYQKSNTPLIVSYFGGLHLNRWKMISRLGKLFKSVNINVYSIGMPSEEILQSFKEANVIFCGGVTGDELKERMKGSDVLLHVESDDTYNRRLTKLSISTKIPEYLMTGKMLLAFGPKEVASIKLISDNQLGLAIASDQSDDLILQDLQVLYDEDQRKIIGLSGYKFALENFDRKLISDNFKSSLEALIEER